ncbi:white-collar 2 [Tothia fuscella]|uniref:White-collar 2 n=1 Tax=Tothia fuscella TaxID=1048955 RepID=A0A9P4NP42_9PEZI|nr:white-collar 2 [Tothia fuscella]
MGETPIADPDTQSLGGVYIPALAPAEHISQNLGAGPLPAGFMQQTSTGSTLTEFTKRRNWSRLILEELRDLMLILSPDGRINHVSPSCKLLTGYEHFQLVSKFVGDFIHDDDKGMFVREFNESIASGNQLRFFYRLRKEDGTYAIFEAFGHPHLASGARDFPSGNGGVRYCRGFFMMSRPYPTRNAALLDSFLEHKIENERLSKRIMELKRDEQKEQEEQDYHWGTEGQSSITPSESARMEARENPFTSASIADSENMPPPSRPTMPGANPPLRQGHSSGESASLNAALTRQNLDEALAAARPDSISDKMARYEGASHIETIEMLTGLRYRDGERSHGISTGSMSPALIRGDAGIAILADRENRSNIDRKKKTKVADEYVCTDCGTLDSPEWRKGPSGPKTLCNACGLRWAKKEKKRHQERTPQQVGGSIPHSTDGQA